MCGNRPGHQDGFMLARVRWDVVSGTLGWVLVVLIIGTIDVVTDPAYGFGFFYLIAVIPAAWYLGRVPGLIVALSSGLAWFVADAAQQRLGTLWPAAWNASSRTLVFVLPAILTHTLHPHPDPIPHPTTPPPPLTP